MQGRHAVDGTYGPGAAQPAQGGEIGALIGTRDGHQFQAQGLGQHLETGIGQGVGGNHIAGLQQGHHRHRQAVLGATDDQHLLGWHSQATTTQMAGDRGPLMHSTGMGLVAQQGFKITGQGELAQGIAQQLGLPGQ
ncbi:hypothetical protein D3C76_1200950 [compost metagenome]